MHREYKGASEGLAIATILPLLMILMVVQRALASLIVCVVRRIVLLSWFM
jgi:hypothetical protein